MSIDAVVEQLDAYNARDVERFLACYASDAVVEDSGGVQLMSDREAMRAFYTTLFADSPDLRAEVLTRIRVGQFVIDEERVTGMQIYGMPEEAHAAVVYQLRDGLIARVRFLM